MGSDYYVWSPEIVSRWWWWWCGDACRGDERSEAERLEKTNVGVFILTSVILYSTDHTQYPGLLLIRTLGRGCVRSPTYSMTCDA